MKQWILGLSLVLLLALTLAGTASAEEANYLNIAPGDCWTVENTGEEDISLSLKGLDYVITDVDGYVKARDVSAVYPNTTPTLPPGGQAILQDWSGGYSGALELTGPVTAVKNDVPLLLHEELCYGETCQFTNITDHSANILVRGDTTGSVPSAWVIFDRDGAVTETDLPRSSSGSNEKVLSVPAGGRAVITPDGYYLYEQNLSGKSMSPLVCCMARSANFTVQRNVPNAWTFGAVGYNQPMAFRNETDEPQTIQTLSCLCALYDRRDKLVEVSSAGGEINVPTGYAVSLSGKDLNGCRYAFLTDAFQSADLPGPVAGYGSRSLAVTFRNVSGKAAPLYGVTESMAEKAPDTYDITGLVSPTEDGKGVLLPNGASVTVTGSAIDIITLQDQFSVTPVGIPETGKQIAAMKEGEVTTLTNAGNQPVTVMLCGKAISVLGDGKDILARSYQGYNWYSTKSDLTISAGGSVTFQAVQGCSSLSFDEGALEYIPGGTPIYFSRVLRAGEGLRSSEVLTGYGNPFYSVSLPQEETRQYSYQAIDATIFSGRPGTMESLEEPLVRSLTLSKGENCVAALAPDNPESSTCPLQGPMLIAMEENGRWYNSYGSRPRAGHSILLDSSRARQKLTALADGCTVRYYPALVTVQKGVGSAYITETIPQGESRIYRAKDAYPNPLVYAYGFNAERRFFNRFKGEWMDAQRGADNAASGDTSWPTVKITATDSDVTVVYLRDQVETGPVLASESRLLGGGETLSPEDVGKSPVDAVELTLLSERTEPFTLILASYDQAGRLIATASQPVTMAALQTTLTIPFPCGTETAVIKAMAVDGQFRPLMPVQILTG